MATTAPFTCGKCQAIVLSLKIEQGGCLVPVNATPDPTGHVVETGNGTGRCLKLDRSDAGGADIYRAHHLSCTG
jgi:hypothetical protein